MGYVLAELHLFLLNGVNKSERGTDEDIVFLAKMWGLSLSSRSGFSQHTDLKLPPNTQLLDLVENLSS